MMEWWATFRACVQHELAFFSWRDIVEIIFFSWAIYGFLSWLNYDKQKNLVFWFYSYCILSFGAYFTQLNTMSLILAWSAPAVLMLFVVIHQQTLQKNFITLKNISLKPDKQYHWLEELMQASLHAVNKNREIICIIERTDSLKDFLTTSCILNADTNREILELLISTTAPTQPITLWTNHAGRLVAINPQWNIHPDETWISDEVKALHKLKQDALFITEKSDSVIFSVSPTTRLFDIMIKGKSIKQISAGHAFSLLKEYSNLSEQKGTDHAHLATKNTRKQKFTEN